MRVVIDTNVLLAAMLWRGPPHALLIQLRTGSLSLVSSPVLLAELANVLARPKFDAIFNRLNTPRDKALAEIRQLAEVIQPPPLPQSVCRDPDDDELLAVAIASQADLIISGDNDLLVLQQFNGIRILSPAQAATLVGEVGDA